MIDRDDSAIKVTGTWAGDNLFSGLTRALHGEAFEGLSVTDHVNLVLVR